MTRSEDTVWRYLTEAHDADNVVFPAAPKRNRIRPIAISAGLTAGIAAAAAAAVLLIGGTATTSRAYAITPQGNGTYTLTINQLASGVAADLNARLAQLGINETVVPIQAGCPVDSDHFNPVGAGATPTSTLKLTIGNTSGSPAGWHNYIAAGQEPDGTFLYAQGTTPLPLPPCFPATPGSGSPDAS
jgi:hypothetical protein